MQGVAMQTCPACQGRRLVPNVRTGSQEICPMCNGAGRVEPEYERRYFIYLLDKVLTASQDVSVTLNIQARAAFEWIWLAASKTGAFQTRISDSSGREFDSDLVNDVNQWGTAQLPFALVVPHLLRAQTNLSFRLKDTSAAANTVQLALIGYELYPVEG